VSTLRAPRLICGELLARVVLNHAVALRQSSFIFPVAAPAPMPKERATTAFPKLL